jgi:type I site-specific restriction endonuclease
VITGAIKSQIDRIWDSFWSGGISNPLEVIEQITYLLFIRRLEDLRTLEENKANRLKQRMVRRIFPEGKDAKGRSYEDYRWSRFKHFAPADMFSVVAEHAFPYLRTDLALQLGNGDSNQLEFVNLIVDHLTERGVMEPARLYESPFTDLTPHAPCSESARETSGSAIRLKQRSAVQVLTGTRHARY